MSFITKREHVFREYDNYELPPRNEGKIKTYSSCTDTRAWSHFGSDKAEHLVDIIKKNNSTCSGKYFPVNVIVEMLMTSKNAEIARLKRKIHHFEKLLSAYDELDLSFEQKCEIKSAKAMIRAASDSLEEITIPAFDLNLSNFTTEGSECFRTGKSSGDELPESARPQSVRFEHDVDQGDKKSLQDWFESEGKLNRQESKTMRAIIQRVYVPESSEKSTHNGFALDYNLAREQRRGRGCSKLTQKKPIHLNFKEIQVNKDGGRGHSVAVRNIKYEEKRSVWIRGVSTRIEELQEELIGKDAKLCALNNTIRIMESDVCEPYCIYAHIFTALEKIFAILRQNPKYQLFLDTMNSVKNTRNIGIKAKILFKLKVLEKFSIALLSPCADRFKYDGECPCQTTKVLHLETTIALKPAESPKLLLDDDKRARLVAEIIENDEMKEILSKESLSQSGHVDNIDDITDYNVDDENLKRLKNLQLNYNELMVCYDEIKYDRDNLKLKFHLFEKQEQELESLRNQLRDYNTLYNEREYFRKRSEDLDDLKEKYLVLADETSSLETELKAETEINQIKSNTIDELRSSNISIEKKLNDVYISCEKEKNALECKLKEAECKMMCQEQQIKSLSTQMDKILEQNREQDYDDIPRTAAILDEIECLKDQLKSLAQILHTSEAEKKQLQEQFEDNLKVINEMKLELEDWKSLYEKTLHHNEYLKKCTEGFKEEVDRLLQENKDRENAVENLMGVINNKSQEVGRLMDDIESKRKENRELLQQLNEVREKFGSSISTLEYEKKQMFDTLQVAKRESKELLDKVRDYDAVCHEKDDLSKLLDDMKKRLLDANNENNQLKINLSSQERDSAVLLDELQRLRKMNDYALQNINSLQNENQEYKLACEINKKETELIENKLKQLNGLQEHLQDLRLSHEKLMEDKLRLESELRNKEKDLENAVHSVEVTRKESKSLLEKLEKSENLREDIISLSRDYQKMVDEKQKLQRQLSDKTGELNDLLHTLSKLKVENEELLQQCNKYGNIEKEMDELKGAFDILSQQNTKLQSDLNLKLEENDNLKDQAIILKSKEMEARNNVKKLQEANLVAQDAFNAVRKESDELFVKLKNYDIMMKEFADLKKTYLETSQENEKLLGELNKNLSDLKRLQNEHENLNQQTKNVMLDNENLEKTLTDVRMEIIKSSPSIPDVIQEVKDLKLEQEANHDKIRQLLDKLDESENRVADLSEDVLARDDKIAMLQNHINALQDEVQKLHYNLQRVLATGEELKDNSYQKIDQTLHKMEAHHSKATHNMKLELAKLQNENYKLEEQLSLTKVKSEESLKEIHRYISQIVRLENEREVIATDVKQIEEKFAGGSNLVPSQCSVEEVIKSLDRIRKCMDVKASKASTLENTLLKVQTSSQLLQTKANEAKKIVEKEKQKIINEKEEAIADKLKMEKQLLDLKAKLEKQTTNDKDIINDLQAEVLNQKLIMDKFKKSTEDYISKLEAELQSLQNMYDGSLQKVNDLRSKVQDLTEEKERDKNIMDKVHENLELKSKEVAALQSKIDKLKNIPKESMETQVPNDMKNKKNQTDHLYTGLRLGDTNQIDCERDRNHFLPSDILVPVPKEVQVLTANVQPSLDYVRNSYVDYKVKRLKPGKLELFSINMDGEGTSANEEIISDNITSNELMGDSPDFNLIDIYRPSSYTTSSKAIEKVGGENTTTIERGPHTMTKSSLQTEFDNNNVFDSYSNLDASPISQNIDSTAMSGSSPRNNAQAEHERSKDLFLIYRDSQSSKTENIVDEKDQWITNRQSLIMAEALSIKPDKNPKFFVKDPKLDRKKHRSAEKYNDKPLAETPKKYQLQVDLPRVEDIQSDADKDSLDSLRTSIFGLLEKNSPRDTPKSGRRGNLKKGYAPFVNDTRSNSPGKTRLSRIKADFLVCRQENGNLKLPQPQRKGKKSDDFEPELVLDSVKRELSELDGVNQLRKTRSEGMSLKSTSSRISSGFEDRDSVNRSVTNKGISVNIDTPDYYESKIRRLSSTIEKVEKDYSKKLEAIKMQYDNNIKSILNDHNQGVRSMQSLHEETLQDVLKIHENEVENLRSMSIEAMRRAEKLENENKLLRNKVKDCACLGLDEEPVKITPDLKKRRLKCHGDMKILTKTTVEAFNVRPKPKVHGPCTCSLDVNVSDTIRSIFEQVDVEQRKMAENTYLKYIANKILSGNVESLDAQELSFLHLKVCRTWKYKLTREEALQRKIDSLESELMSKQRHSQQQHLADLDRKVAEQRRRLLEVQEAVCVTSMELPMPAATHGCTNLSLLQAEPLELHNTTDTTILLSSAQCDATIFDVNERRSAGNLLPGLTCTGKARRKPRPETRAVLAKLDVEEHREKKFYDETPTRLRRAHDRPPSRPSRK